MYSFFRNYVREILCDLLGCGTKRQPTIRIVIGAIRNGKSKHQPRTPNRTHLRVKESEVMLLLTIDQFAPLSIDPRDSGGNPTNLDGVPAWSVSDPNVLDLAPSADGLSCDAIAKNLGTAQVQVSGDADRSAGVKTLTGVLDCQVVAGDAVTLNINAGAPQAKPPVSPP